MSSLLFEMRDCNFITASLFVLLIKHKFPLFLHRSTSVATARKVSVRCAQYFRITSADAQLVSC